MEFIGTLMEGILAISPDGKIVGANRGALEQLALSGAALRMHTLTTLLGTITYLSAVARLTVLSCIPRYWAT